MRGGPRHVRLRPFNLHYSILGRTALSAQRAPPAAVRPLVRVAPGPPPARRPACKEVV